MSGRSASILFFYQFFFWKYQFFGLGNIFQFFEFRPLKKLETPKLDYFITILRLFGEKKRGTCYLGKPKDTTKRTKRHAPRARTANLHNTFVNTTRNEYFDTFPYENMTRNPEFSSFFKGPNSMHISRKKKEISRKKTGI